MPRSGRGVIINQEKVITGVQNFLPVGRQGLFVILTSGTYTEKPSDSELGVAKSGEVTESHREEAYRKILSETQFPLWVSV